MYHFTKNLQGDVTHVYRVSDKAIVATYTYNSWGNIISATGEKAQENPFRYRGYYCDVETGFYYVSSRYYDPEIGRFINEDSLIAQSSVLGNNMFAYCLNNPVNMTDTTGNLPFFAITAVIGAVAGAALGGSVMATTTQVAVGAVNLVSTVATGGLGAGVTYIANNISQVASGGGGQAVTQTVQTGKNVYYHVTSSQAAQTIADSGKLVPSSVEGSVCVLNFQPTLEQARQLGAQSYETVIRFSANCSTFVPDLTVPYLGAYRNMINGAIQIFNVVEVGFR